MPRIPPPHLPPERTQDLPATIAMLTELERQAAYRLGSIEGRLQSENSKILAAIDRLEVKIDLLTERMESGFRQVDQRFEEVYKRFDRVDERFEQVDKRFEEMLTYMGWMIALFGSMFVAIISFAFWDRRTMIRPFESKTNEMDEKIEKLKNNDKTLQGMLKSLRELAKTDMKLAEILKMHNLL